MEEHERASPRLGRQPDGVVDHAMAPVALDLELGRRVLRVVDQDVDALAQLHRAGRDGERTVARLLVIAEVADAVAVPRDPVPAGAPDVWDQPRHHVELADRELRVGDVVEPDVARQLGQRDREQWWPDRVGHHVVHRATVGLRRRIHVELGTGPEQRTEERQALHVVPVQVAQQARPPERLFWRTAEAEVAHARAEVEQDRIVPGRGDRHRRGVAAVPRDLVTVTRGRPPHAVELHRQRFALADLSNRTRRNAPAEQTSCPGRPVFRHGGSRRRSGRVTRPTRPTADRADWSGR